LLNNYFEPSQYYRKRCFLNQDIVEILSRKKLLRLERCRKANRQKKQKTSTKQNIVTRQWRMRQ
jgi:hypothetical protein